MGEAFMLHRASHRLPKFTYIVGGVDRARDKDYAELVNDGHGDWRIKFKVTGTLTFLTTLPKGIDVFLVGGGAGGAEIYLGSLWARSGGGSGYVTTVKDGSIVPVKGTGYGITIGAGGKYDNSGGPVSPTTNRSRGDNGGTTSAFGKTAAGGRYGESSSTNDSSLSIYKVGAVGGNGASGGGCSAYGSNTWPGGYNGTDGTASMHSSSDSSATAGKGVGQNPGTSEFGEGVIFYARGGGSGTGNVPNSGNGGRHNLNGSTGIVVIRNHRE